jgi:hypothetical protein
MSEYQYVVAYKHGQASGSVTADSPDEAKAKAKALYHGLTFDTRDAKGKPMQGVTNVTNVIVKEVQS